MAFLDEIFSNYLVEESSRRNISMDIFNQTESLLIESVRITRICFFVLLLPCDLEIHHVTFLLQCRNLTNEPVETVDEFPSLICSTSNCFMDKINWIVLFVTVALFLISIGLKFCFQSFRTYREADFSLKNLFPEEKQYPTRF